MKEKILAFLKTKLTGVQESFLVGVAENFSKTITSEDQIETTFTDGVIQTFKTTAQFVSSESDRRAEDARKTAVKNFREKYNLDENGKPIETPPTPPKEKEEDVPAWAKGMLDTVTKLSGTVEGIVGSQATAQKLEGVKAKLKEKGLKDKHIDNWASKVNLEAEDLDAEIETHVNTYNEMKQDFINSEVESGAYVPSNHSGASDDEFKSFIEEKKEDSGESGGFAAKKL